MELSNKARQLRNEYQRNYQKSHPNKIKEYAARYWEKKAGKADPDQLTSDSIPKCPHGLYYNEEDFDKHVDSIFNNS